MVARAWVGQWAMWKLAASARRDSAAPGSWQLALMQSLAVVSLESLVVALVYSSTDRLTDCDGCLGNAASIYQLQQLDSTWSSSRSTADLTAQSAPLPSWPLAYSSWPLTCTGSNYTLAIIAIYTMKWRHRVTQWSRHDRQFVGMTRHNALG